MEMLINQIGGIPSQCICTSNHHDVNFKYLTILFVNCTSRKLEKSKYYWPIFYEHRNHNLKPNIPKQNLEIYKKDNTS